MGGKPTAEYQREWRRRNPAKAAQHSKTYRLKNPEKMRALSLAWRCQNLDRVRASRRKSENKRNIQADCRLSNTIKAGMHKHLTKGSKARRRWENLVGYTVDDLKRHLERGFLKGMSWDNYGQWHIDHIIPVSLFNFATPDDPDFRACWALTNLRPLWAPDNTAKCDKRLHLI